MIDQLHHFRQVWLCDFEFHAPTGERPNPLCMVAHEWRTGRTFSLWQDELAVGRPPFSVAADALFVAYYASAELGCFLALDWPMPARILDLCAEFRCHTSGLPVPCGRGLLGALAYHGIDSIDTAEKESMRTLAMRGGEYSDHERAALLNYCETDVVALAKLLPAMLPRIDVPRALLRGRYMAAAARMEWAGIPIDTDTLAALRENWTAIKSRLIAAVDSDYGVFVPTGVYLDPVTPLGAAIVHEADAWGLDAYKLAEVVETLWQERQQAQGDHVAAVEAARKATKLTPNRIAKIEESGRDLTTVEGFDERARTLASELPELGIGRGYESGTNYDETDYAGGLWQLLREPATKPKKSDPAFIRQAAEWLSANGEAAIVRPMSFSATRFADYLIRQSIPWPRLESGALNLSDEAFRQMARQYPAVAPLRELRHSLSQLRLNELAVGSDGRNRCLLSAFASRTGRNQPSNAKYIFGPSVWLRGLIQPAPGRAVAYLDYEQQEFGIAAALSVDKAMQAAYTSGDPYLAFAKQAGAVPPDATKRSHKTERERFKVCALAVQYGMAEQSLAQSLGQPEVYARDLLRLHRETYPTFWKWSQAAVDHAMLYGYLETVFGWRVHVGGESNPRSLANFPMQANGAEMLRLACCLATEQGIQVCAPVHDAVLIEADADAIVEAVEATQAAMRETSQIVLDGFELRSDAKVVAHPDRYTDPRGERMWELVCDLTTQEQGVPF